MEENKEPKKEPNVEEIKMPPIAEPYKSFRVESDLTRLNIINDESGEVLVEISGYDLRIDYNLQYLTSVEAVEAACDGLKELFRQTIMEQLLGGNEQ